ncbi:helix-turn-helix domain-containing protein [Saccharibacillus sacchari]|uniref:Helix-turn-helix domain-containing protein n=1 Tax=Saccharibacillus sacchari TaxID=456493 RepID=A0ACC6P8L4_9BACL
MKSDDRNKASEGAGPVFYLPKKITALERERLLFAVRGTTLSSAILVVTEGVGRLRFEGAERNVSRGSVILCEKEARIRLSGFIRGLVIEYAAYGEAAETNPKLPALFETRYMDIGSSRIVRVAEELAGSWHSRLAQTFFRTQRLFLELVELLNAECRLSEGADAEDWMPRVLDILHDRYAEEWTRQRIAELAGVSEEHFSRSFRRRTGYTFVGYLTLLRIRSVQRSLLLQEGSVQDLATRSGYRDGSDLSRAFKRLVGQSPLSYKQSEKRIVSYNFNYTACLLALGIRPVLGAYSGWMFRTHDGLPPDQRSELSVYGIEECRRMVQALEPDVVLGYDHLDEEREWLSVAPVVGIPFMDMDWREQFRQVAKVAGRAEEAEKLLSIYERKVRQANKKLDTVYAERGTAIIWEVGRNCAYTFGTRFGRAGHVLYGDLGFRFPHHFPENEIVQYGYAEMPFERLQEFAADRIFVIADSKTDRENVRNLFVRTDGSLCGEVHIVGSSDLFYGFDPLSTLRQLEAIQESLAHKM